MKKVLSADVLSPILAYMRLDAPHKNDLGVDPS